MYICSSAGTLTECYTCPHADPHEEIDIGSGMCTEDGPCGNGDAEFIVRCVPATAERIAQALQDFQELE